MAAGTNFRLLPNVALVVCGVVAGYGSRARPGGIGARTRARGDDRLYTCYPIWYVVAENALTESTRRLCSPGVSRIGCVVARPIQPHHP